MMRSAALLAVAVVLGSSTLAFAKLPPPSDEDRAKATASGFDIHLTKPFSMDKLEALLREHARTT